MSGVDDTRAVARDLAARAVSGGEPLRWFEELYAQAARGDAVVPWADLLPNPLLVRELDGLAVSGLRTLVVGCGYGDDAAALARAGAKVTAFDVAPSAVARCRDRFGSLDVEWVVGDALTPAAAASGRMAGCSCSAAAVSRMTRRARCRGH